MDRRLELELRADPSEAKRLRNELHAWLLEAGINGSTGYDIAAAATEAFINAIEHPAQRVSHQVNVRGQIDADRTVVAQDHRRRPLEAANRHRTRPLRLQPDARHRRLHRDHRERPRHDSHPETTHLTSSRLSGAPSTYFMTCPTCEPRERKARVSRPQRKQFSSPMPETSSFRALILIAGSGCCIHRSG